MMSSSLNKLEIRLDNQSSIFTPGSIITGELILDLNNDKTIRAVKLRFKGRCKVHWSRQSGKTRTNYVGKEQYFRSDVILRGSTSGDSIELKAGHYNFPFSFSLPHNIPNSFEHNVGFVRYSIKAIVDRPWKLDYESKILFTIDSPNILGPETLAGIEDDVEESYCCLLPCFDEGSMDFQFRIPKSGYVCGEPLEATVKIQNKSEDVTVTQINLNLEQTIDFHSKNPQKTKTVTEVVQRGSKFGPFRKDTEVTIGLTIPTLPHTRLQYCSLIDITYQAEIIVVVSGCHCDTSRKYEILIGTGPPMILQSQNTVLSANYPTSPLFNAADQPSIVPVPVPMVQPSSFPPYPISINNPPYPINDGMDILQRVPPGIGFVMPHPSAPTAPTAPMPDHLPPSYESVIAQDTRK